MINNQGKWNGKYEFREDFGVSFEQTGQPNEVSYEELLTEELSKLLIDLCAANQECMDEFTEEEVKKITTSKMVTMLSKIHFLYIRIDPYFQIHIL